MARDVKFGKDVDMDELLKNLKLQGDELNDVLLGKEEVTKWHGVKWLATTKVLTSKSFSMHSLKNTMHAAWNPAREVFLSRCGSQSICAASRLPWTLELDYVERAMALSRLSSYGGAI